MARKNIDLSGIKETDLDNTSSFTDLMSRSERKKRKENTNYDTFDIEDMVEERKRSTKDLTIDLEKAKKVVDDDSISNTQTLEITRQMKFNLENNKMENEKKKKNGISLLNIIGEINLICIGYYIYLLVFTNYQDNEFNYTINGAIIILLVFLFGVSIVSNKKARKTFNIINILAILGFILFNIYTLIK